MPAHTGAAGGIEAFSDGGDGDSGDFDWQYLQGALVLLGAAGRCQRCFAGVEKVSTSRSRSLTLILLGHFFGGSTYGVCGWD